MYLCFMGSILERLSDKRFRDICHAITKGHELSDDLYSEVLLILYDKPPPNIETDQQLVRVFFEYAKRTWFLSKSQFNKKFARFNNDIPIEKCSSIYSQGSDMVEQWNNHEPISIHEDDSEVQIKNRTFVESELSRKPSTDCEMFVLEIAKIYFKGHGVTDIHKITGVDRSAISKAIKQFEKNVRNYHYKCSISKDNHEQPVC